MKSDCKAGDPKPEVSLGAQGKFFRNWRQWSHLTKDCRWHSCKPVVASAEMSKLRPEKV